MRPQDLVVLLKILAYHTSSFKIGKSVVKVIPNYTQNKKIAVALKISEAEVSESLRRSTYAELLDDPKQKRVNKKALLDFLVYGVKYVFPAHPGSLVRGVPTAHSAPPLNDMIVSDESYVWEDAGGSVRGQMIEPLFPTVPEVASHDSQLYELLALTDAIRTGSARTVGLASEELEKRIMSAW